LFIIQNLQSQQSEVRDSAVQ